MELRRLGDSLLRPRTAPLLSFLSPSVSTSWRPDAIPYRPHQSRPIQSRPKRSTFHTSTHYKADPPSKPSSSPSTADLDFLSSAKEDSLTQPRRRSTTPTYPQRSSTETMIDSLIGATYNIPKASRPPPSHEPSQSSADLLSTAYRNRNADTFYSQQQQEQPMRLRGARAPGSLAASMQFPASLVSQKSESQHQHQYPKRFPRTIRSRPSLGRTVHIDSERGMDFGRALRTLDIQCAVNRVRSDLGRQRFHERGGMKRKRLRSERWRRLFREGFKATVVRVMQMRRKGW